MSDETHEAVIVRDERGRFLKGTKPANLITSQNATALARKRQEMYRRAAARGLVDELQSISPQVATSADAWGYIIAAQANKLLDQQKPNAQATEIIGRAIGAIAQAGDRQDAEQPAQVIRHEYSIDADALELLAQVRQAQQAQQNDDE